MNHLSAIETVTNDPQKLEDLYQTACAAGKEAGFREELDSLYAQTTDNLLLAAWYYRFLRNPLAKAVRRIPWALAITMGLLTGLALFITSDQTFIIKGHSPAYGLLWAPVATIFCLAYLALAGRKNYRQFLLPALILVIAVVYVLLAVRNQPEWISDPYLDQMAIHLPLLSWISLGLALTGLHSPARNRFAFLSKSIEVAVAAGLFLIFGVAFGFLSVLLFETLEVEFPNVIFRLLGFGGFGLLPILAVATIYDPTSPPEAQDFNQGLSKFIVMLMRLLLPMSLVILVIYILFIPFNFMVPFYQRDVLIVFNVVLFAIMGLLLGVTPLKAQDLSPRMQKALRTGIIILVSLASLVSIYAIAAIVYRSSGGVTMNALSYRSVGGVTMNRLTVIGWNTINLSILLSILWLQWRGGRSNWLRNIHLVISRSTVLYAIWCILVIIAIPLIYH